MLKVLQEGVTIGLDKRIDFKLSKFDKAKQKTEFHKRTEASGGKNSGSVGVGSVRGLENLGNTCFMNATLQCLASVPALVRSLAHTELPVRGGKNHFDAYEEIKILVEQLHAKGIKSSVVPTVLAKNLHRVSSDLHFGYQEDSHEFFIKLMHCMEGFKEDSPERRKLKTEVMNQVFGGVFRSQLTCPRCAYTSASDEPWAPLDLQVNVGDGAFSLGAALQRFSEKVVLGNSDKWKCAGCKKSVAATKHMSILKPPNSLVVTLKRWGTRTDSAAGAVERMMGRGMFRAAKITAHVSFPIELDLSDSLSKPTHCPYSLTGILVHKGSTPQNGHYISYTRSSHFPTGWSKCDDSIISQASEESVLQQSAYMLFYTRVGGIPCTSDDRGSSKLTPVTTAAEMKEKVEDLEGVYWSGGARQPTAAPDAPVFRSTVPPPPTPVFLSTGSLPPPTHGKASQVSQGKWSMIVPPPGVSLKSVLHRLRARASITSASNQLFTEALIPVYIPVLSHKKMNFSCLSRRLRRTALERVGGASRRQQQNPTLPFSYPPPQASRHKSST